MTWNEFVKKIREERKISYKEALKVASPLWQKQKKDKPVKKKRKRTTKKKKYEAPPEISEFPKPTVKADTTRRKIPVTTTKNMTSLGGQIELIDKYGKKGLRHRAKKQRTILLDSAYKSTARMSKV